MTNKEIKRIYEIADAFEDFLLDCDSDRETGQLKRKCKSLRKIAASYDPKVQEEIINKYYAMCARMTRMTEYNYPNTGVSYTSWHPHYVPDHDRIFH